MKNKLKKGQSIRSKSIVLESNFFEKRKKVMAIIYQARKLVPNAPRTEVKILTGKTGWGWTNKDNIIGIGENIPENCLVHVVLHELVHTWFKVKGHNEDCPLMKSLYNTKGENEAIAWDTFKNYI